MDDLQITKPQKARESRGQAMVEYALIVAFVIMTFAITLAMTGPAIGNVFSNVVYNLIGQAPGDTVADLSAEGGAAIDFWDTVTWVYEHPQGETPYPTQGNKPPTVQPTSFSPIDTIIPTNTFTATFTPTKTYTPIPTDTFVPTFGPSPTPEDREFSVPFADRADTVMNWRLDRSFVINASGWTGNYYNGSVCSGSDPVVPVLADTTLINYDWAAGSPDATINNDNFTACWQNNFSIGQTTDLKFTASNLSGGTLTVILNGTTTILNATTTGNTATFNLPASGTLTATYHHTSGNAAVSLTIERVSQNPSDEPASAATGCPWTTTNSNLLSDSPMNVFDDYPAADSWPNGQTCYLELRGWVNSASVPNSKLSFWDVWDFLGASGISAELQIANYTPIDEDNPSVLDRSVWASPLATFNLRGPGTANYNWTRSEIDINSISGIGDHWTFRFVLSNTSGSTQTLRWYIDDVQVLSEPTPTPLFTVNNFWNANQRSQMSDFIFNADANYTTERTTSSPPGSEWRWNITSDRARTGNSWALKDYAPSASPTTGAPDSPRTYYLEFAYPINLTAAPAIDTDGDTGAPILTFWHAYQLGTGASIRIEFTRDARNDTIPDNWTIIPDTAPSSYTNEGMLLRDTTPSTGGRNEANPSTERTALLMSPITIQLNEIPNWNTQPFRLRFSMVLNEGATINTGDGWFIDDIRIERDVASPYVAYDFIDSAEDPTFTAQTWIGTGAWGVTTVGGGVHGSGHSYTDSPGTGIRYPLNTDTWLEMRRTIDLLNDTPDNTETSDTAVTPTMSFWMRRDLQGTLTVQLWTPQTNAWTTAWTMDNTAARSTNLAWERVEIDIREALRLNTGRNWVTTTTLDGNFIDDDIRIRFQLRGTGSTAYDGVWIDEIRVEDYAPLVHQLWAGGNNKYLDTIESNSRGWTLSDTWDFGGDWNTTTDGYQATTGLADSPALSYQRDWLAMAEMRPIIDLTSTTAASLPSLDFFTRYNVQDLDYLRVEIATENVGSGPQVYNNMFNWNAWTAVPISPIGGTQITNARVETMIRWRVNLSSYVGQRIRIRFVLQTNSDGSVADGIVIDNVALNYIASTDEILPLGTVLNWTAPQGDLSTWIAEGDWGLTQQFFTNSGTANLGSGPRNAWFGIVLDCEKLGYTTPPDVCRRTATYDSMLASNTVDVFNTAAPLSTGVERPNPNGTSTLDLWMGAGAVPGTTMADFSDTYAGRWRREVDLAANTTYRVYAISNEGFRLTIDNKTNLTSGVNTVSGVHYIINNWLPHSNMLDIQTVQVDAAGASDRILTAEFFEYEGDAVLSVSIASGLYSFSDSPNTPRTPDYTTVLSTKWGNSSLTFENYFTTPPAGATLSYSLLWKLSTNNTFYVEVSYDGGFTWTTASTETIPGSTAPLNTRTNIPPVNTWVTRSITLTGNSQHVTFRFRLDTRARGNNNNDDGIWISDISVIAP